ncbi:DNA-binding protein Fis [Thiomicrorhabdus immobilis]|uniref:Putative Fis-like DNA-binding protein n=1 Tax=Thiomicrorhabdus immobilis TaxID=2791037 RepID=A0ABM7MF11_9GAMM|nr:helix-turn-helix domain-containing protein [Thiomicrorhabdus immobilis]BCN93994.1 DNA-binding protein Fis [Thiomicrorhabdus immobilis]
MSMTQKNIHQNSQALPTSSLSQQVTSMLETYFNTLEEQSANDVYEMVLQQVERPLIEFVLQQTENNQTHAANILGINRNTLKKKMQKYDLA